MPITLNGTTGITTPSLTSEQGLTSDGISFANNTPSNTLVTTTGGNVGIGTATPNANSGTSLVVYDSATPRFRLTNSTTGQAAGDGAELSLFGSDFYIENREAANMIFYNNAAERMRITSGGVLVVGATTQSYGEKLRVYNAAADGNAAFFWHDSTADRDVLIIRNERATGSTAAGMMSFLRSGGVNVGSIYSNGTGTTYATSSDYRLKENVAPMTGALAKVSALKPCTYTWKDGGLQGQGFIAHELQEVVPECVVGEKDAVNEDGTIKAQSIDTSFLVATLTAAIQELKAELDTVKTELATLKGQA